jgi:hypothetical protein
VPVYKVLSSVGTATDYGLDCGVCLTRARDFSHFFGVYIDSEAHVASYAMGTGGPFSTG